MAITHTWRACSAPSMTVIPEANLYVEWRHINTCKLTSPEETAQHSLRLPGLLIDGGGIEDVHEGPDIRSHEPIVKLGQVN